jgi:hypothetical protein
MHIFRHIFLSHYWWHKSDIWSQASYRYPISWETFLDPSDSYFLFADFVDFYTHLTCTGREPIISQTCTGRGLIITVKPVLVENQLLQSRQTGRRNLMGPKTLPTIWGTYMKLVFLNPSDSYFLFVDFVDFYRHWTYMLIFRRIFLSNYWSQKSDIWSQAS